MTDVNKSKQAIELWANEPYITCDTDKCGQCLRQQIQSEVAKSYLDSGATPDSDMIENVLDETRKRWRQTPIYIRVKSLLDQGKEFEEIELELKKEGIQV
jgi:hypothetical protein